MTANNMPKIIIRLPSEVKEWLVNQAERNASSQSSEIVRALRERMERVGSSDPGSVFST